MEIIGTQPKLRRAEVSKYGQVQIAMEIYLTVQAAHMDLTAKQLSVRVTAGPEVTV